MITVPIIEENKTMFNKKDKIIDVTSDSVDADPKDAQEMKRREAFVDFIQQKTISDSHSLKIIIEKLGTDSIHYDIEYSSGLVGFGTTTQHDFIERLNEILYQYEGIIMCHKHNSKGLDTHNCERQGALL